MIFTGNPFIDPVFYFMALEGYCEITLALSVHAMKFQESKERGLCRISIAITCR